MKNTIVQLIALTLLTASTLSATPNTSRIENDPGLALNPQDVPIFYEGNPLEGLDSFAVIPPYSIQNKEVNKKIQAIIEKELGSIGTVVKAKSEDLAGFGSGNLINIQIGRVSKWQGGDLPISRITLNVETPVIMKKTNTKSLPRVWSINDFVDSPLDTKSEDKAIGPVQKLLKEFIQNYKFANPDQSQKPTFYVYF